MASCSTRAVHLYYTDGSDGERGTLGAAFVCRPLTVAHRLPPYTTAFQIELTALLLALRHASEEYVGDIHLFIDSLASLHSLHHDSPKDNIQLLSAIHQQLGVIYRSGTCYWIPGYVGVSGNKRADTAAQIAGVGPRVTFTILRSVSSIKTTVNREALKATRNLFDTVPVGILIRHGNSTRITPPFTPPDSWCCHTRHSPTSWSPVFHTDTSDRSRALPTLLCGEGEPSSPLPAPLFSDTRPPSTPVRSGLKGLSPIRRAVL